MIGILKICTVTIAFFTVLSIDTWAQQPVRHYDSEWKKVMAFVEKGLPKSALVEVKKIYSLAKADKQDAQIIKSLVFIIGLQSQNFEDYQDYEIFSIKEIEKE